MPFDVFAASPLLHMSHLQSLNTNMGLISARKATESFSENHTQKDHQEHCKTAQ